LSFDNIINDIKRSIFISVRDQAVGLGIDFEGWKVHSENQEEEKEGLLEHLHLCQPEQRLV
jgi:hypothetical protein